MSFLKSQIAARLRSIFVAVAVLHQLVLCVPQETLTRSADVHASALPDLNGPSSSASTCGGCYIVADVAGLVWYSEIFLNTGATAVVNIGLGNGTRATSTSLIRNVAQFTFEPSMATAMGSPLAVTSIHYDSTLTLGGAVLSSPTPYNVISAYSITSAYIANGACVTTSGSPILLPSAYTETLPSANGQVTLDAVGEQSFIDFLGFSSCSGGGETVVQTAVVQVRNITSTTTTTRSSVSLAAAMSLAPTSTPAPTTITGGTTTLTDILTTITATLPSTTLTSTLITSSTSTFSSSSLSSPSSSSTTSFASVTDAPKIVYGSGSSTITLNANPVALPYVPGNQTLTANGTTVMLPTGSAGGITGSFVPFVGGAANFKDDSTSLSLWAIGIVSLICVVGIL